MKKVHLLNKTNRILCCCIITLYFFTSLQKKKIAFCSITSKVVWAWKSELDGKLLKWLNSFTFNHITLTHADWSLWFAYFFLHQVHFLFLRLLSCLFDLKWGSWRSKEDLACMYICEKDLKIAFGQLPMAFRIYGFLHIMIFSKVRI